jgi:catechol 2,3-dioxygenase-like lactoylglutathione lyase family enzyme
MLSHVFLGVNDFDRAMAFYSPVLERLGLVLRFTEPARPWAGWQTPGVARPLFLIGRPFDGQPAAPGNGAMNALLAADRATVDAVHALALQHGGRCEGLPGLRPEYHANYYGAYFRDSEGNKLCVCCHGDA